MKKRDNKLRLLYLIQYCEDKAKSLIQYCVLMDPDATFHDMMEFVKEEAQVVCMLHIRGKLNKQSKTSAKQQCPYCSERHLLWDCSTFARKRLNERLQVMR